MNMMPTASLAYRTVLRISVFMDPTPGLNKHFILHKGDMEARITASKMFSSNFWSLQMCSIGIKVQVELRVLSSFISNRNKAFCIIWWGGNAVTGPFNMEEGGKRRVGLKWNKRDSPVLLGLWELGKLSKEGSVQRLQAREVDCPL